MRKWWVSLGGCVLLLSCGGEEFASSGSGGASGTGGTSGTGGASGSGGAASGGGGGAPSGGGAAGVGAAGGAAGGGGGSTGGGGGNTGGGGGNTGGAAGSSGGSAGTAGNGGSGGSTGGTGGTVAGCGVPSAVQSNLLLHTTLDNMGAAQNPAFIKSQQTGYVAGTFVTEGPCGGAFQVSHNSHCVKYPAPQNLELQKGTIDFFFKPNFNTTDGVSHKLFALTSGYMLLSKTASPENFLSFGMPSTPIVQIAPGDVGFVNGQWKRITVAWLENSGQITVNIYLDGVQKGTGTKAVPSVAVPSPLNMYVGNLGCVAADYGAGVYDDFKIYDTNLPPP